MPSTGARLFANFLIAIFCLPGPILLLVTGVTVVQRIIFLDSAKSAQGQVIALREAPVKHRSRPSYFPVFRFTVADGQTYTVTSNIGDRQTAWLGKPVPVLYSPTHPQTARINTFPQLWEDKIIPGVIGAAFSTIPLLILIRRRTAKYARP